MSKVTIGITCGDPAGIGPEITRKALSLGKFPKDIKFIEIGEDDKKNTRGKSNAISAKIALNALEDSVKLLKAKRIDAIVTAPVSKSELNKLGFNFPGQTEFFANAFKVKDYAMIMTGDNITIGLATIHVPLAEVPKILTKEKIFRAGKHLANFLIQKNFSRNNQKIKIATAGLNPHAGENGLMGTEEQTIISPAVAELNNYFREKNVAFSQPLPADTLFNAIMQKKYDGVLCMYHDQGLIPVKLIDSETVVNVTMGLPIIRTSPGHGTAFDVAGKNIANPSSMLSAINLAIRLAK